MCVRAHYGLDGIEDVMIVSQVTLGEGFNVVPDGQVTYGSLIDLPRDWLSEYLGLLTFGAVEQHLMRSEDELAG